MPQRAGEKLISAGTSSGVCPACGVAWWPDTLSDSGQPATGPPNTDRFSVAEPENFTQRVVVPLTQHTCPWYTQC